MSKLNFYGSKRGAVFMLMAFIAIVLFVFLLAVFEVTKVYSVHYEVETKLKRLVNNCVESNMDDEARQDSCNYLNTSDAETSFKDLFYYYTDTTSSPNGYIDGSGTIYGSKVADNNFVYMIVISEIKSYRGNDGAHQASLSCEGTLYIAPSIPGALNKNSPTNFVFEVPLSIKSENFKTE